MNASEQADSDRVRALGASKAESGQRVALLPYFKRAQARVFENGQLPQPPQPFLDAAAVVTLGSIGVTGHNVHCFAYFYTARQSQTIGF
jgi:hypothetical protein